jgi:hypothetical protein
MKKLAPLVFLVALTAAGCGSSTTTIIETVQVPASTTATRTATATTTESSADDNPAPPRVPTVGDALTLRGFDTTMRVKLLDVLDPATIGEFDSVDGRLVGVRVKMTNVGDHAYSDSPSNGALLITRDDEQADPTLMSGGDCAGSFSSSTKIAPGSARVGCIAFDVPNGKQLKTFQFTLDSGFADESGEWRIAGVSASDAPSKSVQPSAVDTGGEAVDATPEMSACDSNISVDPRTTTCPFANNVFWEYWTGGQVAEVSAWSTALQRYVDVTCQSGERVVCAGREGSRISFPESAVEAYSQSQADDYASSHEVGP